MHKTLILFAALSFLIFTGACFTPSLYNDRAKMHSFKEEVKTFLITENGQQLIVVGKEHHYIFPASDMLKFILPWSEKNRVKASFSSFRIKTDQSLSGTYNLTIRNTENLSPEIHQELIAKGFADNKALKILTYHGMLRGKRYLANDVKVPETMQLNTKYTINMREEEPMSVSDVAKRIA